MERAKGVFQRATSRLRRVRRGGAYSFGASVAVAGVLFVAARFLVEDDTVPQRSAADAAAPEGDDTLATYRDRAVQDWTVQDVASWVAESATDLSPHPFEASGVDGEVLLRVKDDVDALVSELGVGTRVAAHRFAVRVDRAAATQRALSAARTASVFEFFRRHPRAWLAVPYAQFSPYLFWFSAWKEVELHDALFQPLMRSLGWLRVGCVPLG